MQYVQGACNCCYACQARRPASGDPKGAGLPMSRSALQVRGHGVRCLCPERARSQSPGCAEHPGSKEPGRVLYPNGVRSQASRGAAWSRSEVRSPADGDSARPRGWRSYPVGVQDPPWLLRPGVLSAPRALRSCPFRAQTPIAWPCIRAAARHRKPCPVGGRMGADHQRNVVPARS